MAIKNSIFFAYVSDFAQTNLNIKYPNQTLYFCLLLEPYLVRSCEEKYDGAVVSGNPERRDEIGGGE